MALLAKHMAAADSSATVPGTDQESVSEIAFGAEGAETTTLGISTKLDDVLPVPDTEISLKTILKFRKKYKSELLSFRATMDTFERSLVNAENVAEVHSLVLAHKEKVVRECMELGKALRWATKMRIVLGSLQAFIKPNSPTILGATAVLVGKATSLTTIPISYVAAGASVAGAIEVAAHLFDKLEERRQTLSNSPFAYVFLAKKKLERK
jgi:hypothetical protein